MKDIKKQENYIRYWHPRKGGWYHGRLVKAGWKWAWVRPLQAASNGIVVAEGRRMRVPAGDIQEVTA